MYILLLLLHQMDLAKSYRCTQQHLVCKQTKPLQAVTCKFPEPNIPQIYTYEINIKRNIKTI